jgi:hypothetical protein
MHSCNTFYRLYSEAHYVVLFNMLEQKGKIIHKSLKIDEWLDCANCTFGTRARRREDLYDVRARDVEDRRL